MYRITIRQLILLSLISALLAGTFVAVYDRYGKKALPTAIATSDETALSATEGEKAKAQKNESMSWDEKNNIDVYETISPGVVNITSTTYVEDFWGFEADPQQGTGSGSIIDKQGHILTNVHVVKGAQELTVTLADKTTYPAKVVGTDPDNDLAVIKISAPAEKLHVVPLGTSQELHIGQKVLAIGNPFGLDRTLTSGIISGLGRPLKTANGRTVDNVIQTDASINPGNSGGPLLNSKGEMIGVNTAIYSPSGGSVGIGFAVPVDIAKRIIPELINYGQVLRPWLGIGTRTITPQLASAVDMGVKEGLIITGTLPEGPAGRAGIKGSTNVTRKGNRYYLEADVLTKVGDTRVKSEEDLYRALNNYKPTDTIQVEIYRNGQPMNISVKLEPRPKLYNR
ncbi:MAG: trypsin-like peptidase domain-containing protein [Acidobacteria bacterium]|nr:trypsin-like peptidase domain-containing protein [Acidobacteriota bacterium]